MADRPGDLSRVVNTTIIRDRCNKLQGISLSLFSVVVALFFFFYSTSRWKNKKKAKTTASTTIVPSLFLMYSNRILERARSSAFGRHFLSHSNLVCYHHYIDDRLVLHCTAVQLLLLLNWRENKEEEEMGRR